MVGAWPAGDVSLSVGPGWSFVKTSHVINSDVTCRFGFMTRKRYVWMRSTFAVVKNAFCCELCGRSDNIIYTFSDQKVYHIHTYENKN
jgi:hypothetical protein